MSILVTGVTYVRGIDPLERLDDLHASAAARAGRRMVAIHWIVGVVALVRRRRGDRGHIQQLAAQGKLLGTVAVGEQAIVTNAMEAIGQNVQEEPAHKLVWCERHDF